MEYAIIPIVSLIIILQVRIHLTVLCELNIFSKVYSSTFLHLSSQPWPNFWLVYKVINGDVPGTLFNYRLFSGPFQIEKFLEADHKADIPYAKSHHLVPKLSQRCP